MLFQYENNGKMKEFDVDLDRIFEIRFCKGTTAMPWLLLAQELGITHHRMEVLRSSPTWKEHATSWLKNNGFTVNNTTLKQLGVKFPPYTKTF